MDTFGLLAKDISFISSHLWSIYAGASHFLGSRDKAWSMPSESLPLREESKVHTCKTHKKGGLDV